ncbi:MAG TPA: amino acid permease [Candidatus Xenobia bacterium]|nr:amino acid permease [Candidatus Xenobia bacterium]
MGSQLWRTRSIDHLIAGTDEPGRRLRKALGPWALVALGIGAVIGTGVWTLSGTAALGVQLEVPSIWRTPVLDLLLHGADATGIHGRPGAGPAVALSYILVAVACGFAALCYAELASSVPVAGSAYTYSYATLGELVAWIIGWDLILEYAVSNSAVAVGFSGHLNEFLQIFGLHLPPHLSKPIFNDAGQLTGAWFNLPAFLIVMILTVLLVQGIRETAGANNVMVIIKVAAILLFIVGAASYIKVDNLRPFMPNGPQSVLTGAALVFFAYIGFDSVSTAAEECRNAQRDMPFGIIGTLIVCMLLYVGVAVTLTGIVPYLQIDPRAPVASALKQLGLHWLEFWVVLGALTGMVSSLLVYQLGQARIWFAMSRDGLLPKAFSRVHARHQTPHISTWVAGVLVGLVAGVWDIGELAELSNIGTLFAFVLVCAAVMVLRKTRPDLPRGFRVPFSPLLPILGIISCTVLMISLPLLTWVRFFIWLAIGLAIYFGYSRKRSALHSES